MIWCVLGSYLLPCETDGKGGGALADFGLIGFVQVDIFSIPSLERVHRSVGAGAWPIGSETKTGEFSDLIIPWFEEVIDPDPTDTGTVMALSIFVSSSSDEEGSERLNLITGYEDGSVALFQYEPDDSDPSTYSEIPTKRREEGQGWKLIWDFKGHREAGASRSSSPCALNFMLNPSFFSS